MYPLIAIAALIALFAAFFMVPNGVDHLLDNSQNYALPQHTSRGKDIKPDADLPKTTYIPSGTFGDRAGSLAMGESGPDGDVGHWVFVTSDDDSAATLKAEQQLLLSLSDRLAAAESRLKLANRDPYSTSYGNHSVADNEREQNTVERSELSKRLEQKSSELREAQLRLKEIEGRLSKALKGASSQGDLQQQLNDAKKNSAELQRELAEARNQVVLFQKRDAVLESDTQLGIDRILIATTQSSGSKDVKTRFDDDGRRPLDDSLQATEHQHQGSNQGIFADAALSMETQELQKRLGSERTRSEALRENLAVALKQLAQANNQVSNLTSERDSTDTKLQTLGQQAVTLGAKLSDSMSAQSVSLGAQARLDAETSRAAMLYHDGEVASDDLAQISKEREFLSASLTKKTDELQAAGQTIDALKKQLATALVDSSTVAALMQKRFEQQPASTGIVDHSQGTGREQLAGANRGADNFGDAKSENRSDLRQGAPLARVASTGQAAPQVAVLSENATPHVVVRYSKNNEIARSYAAKLYVTLQAQGMIVIEPVAALNIMTTRVTYYYDEDQQLAKIVGSQITASRTVQGRPSHDELFPIPGTIDVAIAGS